MKISLKNVQNSLKRDEMRKITGGKYNAVTGGGSCFAVNSGPCAGRCEDYYSGGGRYICSDCCFAS